MQLWQRTIPVIMHKCRKRSLVDEAAASEAVLALSEDNQVGDPFDIMRRVNRAIYRHRRRRYSERDNQTVA